MVSRLKPFLLRDAAVELFAAQTLDRDLKILPSEPLPTALGIDQDPAWSGSRIRPGASALRFLQVPCQIGERRVAADDVGPDALKDFLLGASPISETG